MTDSTASRDATGVGILRATITVLVIAFHVALGYHPFAPPPLDSLRTAPFWQAFPVVDPDRWHGALWFVAFNDTFFMSLMFLISGLFVWRSLSRKGGARHLADRARRLGLPFLVGAALLAPLAYFPSYLQTGAPASWAGFWREWLALSNWPAGPAWFLWLLLAFNVVAVALHAVTRRWHDRLTATSLRARPAAAFAVLIAASAVTYVTLALAFSPIQWTTIGPFAFQTSRVLHYAVYFAAGIGFGAAGIDRGLIAPGGRLAARWPAWALLAIVAFGASIVLVGRDIAAGGTGPWHVASAVGFVVACAALCFAFLAGFLRLPWPRWRLLDSLRASAYAMYVIHYAIVSWVLYALLDVALPGAAKFGLAFAAALAASWLVAAGLRAVGRTASRAVRPAALDLPAPPADRAAA
jgi:surface polysaccharide O-acyltransferase-like enzyme